MRQIHSSFTNKFHSLKLDYIPHSTKHSIFIRARINKTDGGENCNPLQSCNAKACSYLFTRMKCTANKKDSNVPHFFTFFSSVLFFFILFLIFHESITQHITMKCVYTTCRFAALHLHFSSSKRDFNYSFLFFLYFYFFLQNHRKKQNKIKS